jgi:hypothetical protein
LSLALSISLYFSCAFYSIQRYELNKKCTQSSFFYSFVFYEAQSRTMFFLSFSLYFSPISISILFLFFIRNLLVPLSTSS